MGKKTPADPTGQGTNRVRSGNRLKRRLTDAERVIKRMFRSIPRTAHTERVISNAERAVIYDYVYPPEAEQRFDAMVRELLDELLLETQLDAMPPGWWWQEDIELPYRQGTLETTSEINKAVIVAIVAGVLAAGLPPRRIEPRDTLTSPTYRQALNKQYVDNFGVMKGLSDTTATQVMAQVNLGIDAGEKPSVIASNITKRFDVAKSSAERIARTQVNKAYNDARVDVIEKSAERTGLRAVVLHISALLTSTRVRHAKRHGNAYTPAQQNQWWNEDNNRINCYCTTRPALVDSRGKLIEESTQQEIKAERELFDQIDTTGR